MPRTVIRLPRRLWWAAFLRSGRPSLARVEATYRALLADAPPAAAAHPMLTWHLRQSIGPVLAFYLTVLEDTNDREYARAEAERSMVGQMKPVVILYATANRVGVPFSLVRVFTRVLLPRLFPAPGFAVDWRADTRNELAFDIHGCFYLRVLSHYGAPELTGVFCHGDRILFDQLARTVRFDRSSTLAYGADRCDFAFHRN